MNKYIFPTIRAGFVLSLAFFAFTSTAFASVILVPSAATEVTKTTAIINGQIINPHNDSYVWFEWADNASLNSSVMAGKQSFYGGRSFETTLEGLNPGTTYYYRVIAVSKPVLGEAGDPIYSSVTSFKTASDHVATTSGSSVTNSGSTQGGTTNSNTTTSTKSSTGGSVKNTNSSVSTEKKNISKVGATTATDGFDNDNANGASVLVAGDGVLPTTLAGWVALFIAVFVAVLLVRMIYEESEKRKKAQAAKKAAEAAGAKPAIA